MYKTKLQELCQRNSWKLPEYETEREGPPHNASFSTTVTVNEISFRSISASRTSKQSQNDAAMLAFNHFSQQFPNPISIPFPSNFPSFPQPSLSSTPGSSGHSPDLGYIDQPNHNGRNQERMLHVYKNQLQCYAQKRNLNLPAYSSEWEGPPHAMRFKSKVTIDGQTFESPKFYSTLKDAEHAAAEIALMTLSPSGLQEDSSGLYKNLLQEVVQKEGFCLPLYSTQISGEAHMPMFVSTVEVNGEHFTGQEAKSKKQAEMSAAKVAYTTLIERKAHQGQAPEFPPYCSEESVITGLQHPSNRKSPVNPGLVVGNQPNKNKGESDQSSLFPLSANHGQDPYLISEHSKSNVGTELHPNSDPKSLVSHGLVTRDHPNKNKGESDQSSSFPLAANDGQGAYLTSDHSKSNVGTDLQLNSDRKSLLSSGFVARDQPIKDKVEKGSSSVGSANGGSSSDSKNVASKTSDMSSTAVSTPSGKKKVIVGTDLQLNSDRKSLLSSGLVARDQPIKDKVEKGSSSVGSANGGSSSDSKNVASKTSDMSSTAVSTPSGKKKVIVYSRKTNVEIQEGGTLLPISDSKWVAYAYSQ